MKEIDIKELKPALKTIVIRDTSTTFFIISNSNIVFRVMSEKATPPEIVRKLIIDIFFGSKVFRMQVPKLLKTTLDKFAANPMISICTSLKIGCFFSELYGEFYDPKITPKRAPTVQLKPSRDPQQIS